MTDGDMNLLDRALTIDIPNNPLAVSVEREFDRYLKTMLPGSGHSGLMERAVDYSAKLLVTESAPGELHITTELILEE